MEAQFAEANAAAAAEPVELVVVNAPNTRTESLKARNLNQQIRQIAKEAQTIQLAQNKGILAAAIEAEHQATGRSKTKLEKTVVDLRQSIANNENHLARLGVTKENQEAVGTIPLGRTFNLVRNTNGPINHQIVWPSDIRGVKERGLVGHMTHGAGQIVTDIGTEALGEVYRLLILWFIPIVLILVGGIGLFTAFSSAPLLTAFVTIGVLAAVILLKFTTYGKYSGWIVAAAACLLLFLFAQRSFYRLE